MVLPITNHQQPTTQDLQTIIHTKDLRKSYQSGNRSVQVINGIDLEIYKGDFTVIMGSSGSGKSTLLYLLSGLEPPSSGEIWMEQHAIHTIDERTMTQLRREVIGFVFQDFNLVPNLTFLENILIPAYLINNDRNTLQAKAKGLMEQMAIADLSDRLPSEVSGGEQQRCSMARAVINDPTIIMADEPTGNLNSNSSQAVLNILSNLYEEGQSIIMVTHDIKSAIRGNRIVFIRDGQVEDSLRFDKEMSLPDKENQLLKWLAGKNW